MNKKMSLKSLSKEKKQEKKKWKEQKLLKAATELKKEILESKHLQEPTSNADSELDETSNTRLTGPSFTISIAVPGSILENAQSHELRTYLAGQIARAACIYCVDEVGKFIHV